MLIKILGSGCLSCNRLYENTKEAVETLRLEAVVEKVTDFRQIASFKVIKTPALVVDEKVIVSGRVLSVEEIIDLLRK